MIVKLYNSAGCVLDSRDVDGEDDNGINHAVQDIVLNCILEAGDRIVIEETN